MATFRTLWLVPSALLMCCGVALAQAPAPAPAPQRGYMTGSAGTVFADQSATTFGVEIGERIGRRVQAYTTFTYFDDLLNDRARNDLTQLSALLTALSGVSWNLQGRDRGLAFAGGAKYLLSDGPTLRPYVGGGPGVLNLHRFITDSEIGDVSDPVLAVFGAPDGVIDSTKQGTFKPMAEFIAGVAITKGRAYVDLGYRFRKVFRSSESFTFSQFTVGVGMPF